MIEPSCVRAGKNKRKKRERRMFIYCRRTELSCRFQITFKKAWHGIRCVSALKSSATKFSEEKLNRVETDCCYSVYMYLSRNSDFCFNLKKPHTFRAQSCVPFDI